MSSPECANNQTVETPWMPKLAALLIAIVSLATSACSVSPDTAKEDSAKEVLTGVYANRGTGPLEDSAMPSLRNENVLIGPEHSLQSSKNERFKDVVNGTHGDRKTKYLWTIDERGINIAREATPFPTPRGCLVHTNLSDRASIAGEAWFRPFNTVIINAGSGRFGDRAGITRQEWQAAVDYWKSLGYRVKAVPFGER